MNLAGLLTCSAVQHLPIVDWTVVCRSNSRALHGGELTATGIAPDLHRTSLLMAPRANQNLHEYINFSFIPAADQGELGFA
jgi:hypothetical protein